MNASPGCLALVQRFDAAEKKLSHGGIFGHSIATPRARGSENGGRDCWKNGLSALYLAGIVAVRIVVSMMPPSLAPFGLR